MKILIAGATMGSNFGDFLFAYMFQNYIEKQIGEENTFWHKNHFTMSSFYANYLNYHRTYKLKEIDALIYMSGGYFCGNDKNLKHLLLRYYRYFGIGLKCIYRKIPYAIIAVEVGPSGNWLMKSIVKTILSNATLLIVRNNESQEYINSICGKNIKSIVTTDSAFSIQRSLFEDRILPDSIIKSYRKKLFFHIAPYYDRNSILISKIVPIINLFIQNHPEYDIFIGTDQYTEEQQKAIEQVREHIKSSNVFSLIYNDPIALCKVLDNMDVIITNKLHVGIVGCHLGKSVISFSGHTEKIKRLYKQLGIPERTIPLSELTTDKGLELIEEKHDKPVVVPDEIRKMACKNFELLTEFINEIPNFNNK